MDLGVDPVEVGLRVLFDEALQLRGIACLLEALLREFAGEFALLAGGVVKVGIAYR